MGERKRVRRGEAAEQRGPRQTVELASAPAAEELPAGLEAARPGSVPGHSFGQVQVLPGAERHRGAPPSVSLAVRLPIASAPPAADGVVQAAGRSDAGAETTETAASPEVQAGIEQAQGGGQALDASARAGMEAAIGADFSGVRIHTDAEADRLSRQVNAQAFTVGEDIFFRAGHYSPQAPAGRELLAHELTHVVQQGSATVQPKLVVGAVDDVYEREADRVAARVSRGERAGEAGEAAAPGRAAPSPARVSRLSASRGVIRRRGQPIPAGATPVPAATNSVDGSLVVGKLTQMGQGMWTPFQGFAGTPVERQILNAFETSNLQPRSIAIDYADTRGVNMNWSGTVNIRMENPTPVQGPGGAGAGQLSGAGGGTGTSGTSTSTQSTSGASVEGSAGGHEGAAGGKVGGSAQTQTTQGESVGATGQATTGLQTSDTVQRYTCTIVADIFLRTEPDFSGSDYVNPFKWGFAGAAALDRPMTASDSVACGTWTYQVSTGIAPVAAGR